MKPIAPNPGFKITERHGKMRGNLRDRLVKRCVKARKLRSRRKDLLRSRNERQGLRHMQRRKVYGRPQLLQHLRRDDLMAAEARPPVHHPMPHTNRHPARMFLNCLSYGVESLTLRFADTHALLQRCPVGRPDP